MKKHLLAIFAIMLCPIFLLAGCGSLVAEFERTTTNTTIFNFYNSVISNQNDYKTLISGYSKTDLDSTETTALNTSLTNYSNLNNELFMALPAIDLRESGDDFGLYDLSKIDSTLSSYNLYEKSADKYILKISGGGDNSYLPIVSLQIANTTIDVADEIISTMGNAVQFDVGYSNISKSWSVDVKSTFYYPSEQDVPNSNENGIQIKRTDGQSKITIVYTANSQTYSKVVEFLAKTETAPSTKRITKYAGDLIANPNLSSTGSYNYLLSSPELIGAYEFKFDSSNSYFYGKHTKSSGNYSFVECYNLKSNISISRLTIVKTSELNQSIEFLIGADSSGKLKYKRYAGSFAYMSDFDSLSKQTFAVLTDEEKTQTNKIYGFTFSNGAITCESVGI